MKKYLLIITVSLLVSCSGDFINHKLSYEKKGDCIGNLMPVQITANIAGERYEFETCLGDDFDGKNYRVTRSGDTINVLFPKSRNNAKTFKITVDIDARPAYNVIILDNQVVPLAQHNNSNEQN